MPYVVIQDPFPHTAAWNPTFRERADDEDEDEYWAKRNAWEKAVYFHPKQTYGAICLCHEGCAIRDWLVVTGAERGHMWLDDRASDGGLMPRKSNGGRVGPSASGTSNGCAPPKTRSIADANFDIRAPARASGAVISTAIGSVTASAAQHLRN